MCTDVDEISIPLGRNLSLNKTSTHKHNAYKGKQTDKSAGIKIRTLHEVLQSTQTYVIPHAIQRTMLGDLSGWIRHKQKKEKQSPKTERNYEEWTTKKAGSALLQFVGNSVDLLNVLQYIIYTYTGQDRRRGKRCV